ncbi:MAG: NAD-dependent epimerase/dehydratase family protein [Nostoc sp. ChiQUE01a]|nr:NAD-dependent epimerase/dehydratase family protein [Nostoc sp. ChiQUE01a]
MDISSAAAQAKVKRVVFFSSVDALGIFKGERKPDYLPLDDNHPCYPTTPYAVSKRLGEEMCRYFTNSTDRGKSSEAVTSRHVMPEKLV